MNVIYHLKKDLYLQSSPKDVGWLDEGRSECEFAFECKKGVEFKWTNDWRSPAYMYVTIKKSVVLPEDRSHIFLITMHLENR